MNTAPNPLGIHCVDCSTAAPCQRCQEQITAEAEYDHDNNAPRPGDRIEYAQDDRWFEVVSVSPGGYHVSGYVGYANSRHGSVSSVRLGDVLAWVKHERAFFPIGDAMSARPDVTDVTRPTLDSDARICLDGGMTNTPNTQSPPPLWVAVFQCDGDVNAVVGPYTTESDARSALTAEVDAAEDDDAEWSGDDATGWQVVYADGMCVATTMQVTWAP